MILSFCTMKEIMMELDVSDDKIHNQLERMHMTKAWLTSEEKKVILNLRKQHKLL